MIRLRVPRKWVVGFVGKVLSWWRGDYMPLLGRQGAHPKLWGVGGHMKDGRMQYRPDPRWSKEAIAARAAEVDKRHRRALVAEARREREAAQKAGIRRLPRAAGGRR